MIDIVYCDGFGLMVGLWMMCWVGSCDIWCWLSIGMFLFLWVNDCVDVGMFYDIKCCIQLVLYLGIGRLSECGLFFLCGDCVVFVFCFGCK